MSDEAYTQMRLQASKHSLGRSPDQIEEDTLALFGLSRKVPIGDAMGSTGGSALA